jgi:hypothetical protein
VSLNLQADALTRIFVEGVWALAAVVGGGGCGIQSCGDIDMTRQQLLSEIVRLSLAERVELLEAITRSVREEIQPRAHRRGSVGRLRGIAKPDGPAPSDEELKEDYVNYLAEKYS